MGDSSADFIKMLQESNNETDRIIAKMERGRAEAERIEAIAHNTPKILDELDKEFCEKTKLTAVDMAFLFTAIGLQIARQYLLTKFPERMDDQTAAKKTSGHNEEHSNRMHRLYNPSLEEIKTNPVPFDAHMGANGALAGGGELKHRATAIGHDPILGLIFGTANIATSTLTNASFESYHIYTGFDSTGKAKDAFKNRARTDLVLQKTCDKLIYGGIDGKIIVATSLTKEIVHLRSDLYTKNSLPLPIVSSIDPKFASYLAGKGLDMANVVTIGKQATMAIFINSLIAMIHGLFYAGNSVMDQRLYEVRTRKILSYSNIVASSSNLLVTFGLTHDMRNLDIGGFAVTLYRVITDRKFIRKVKEEFVFGTYRDMIKGD